jgi:hypothetical protein
MLETANACPYGGQADWNELVTDGYCMPVDGQLDGSSQVRDILGRDEFLSVPDLCKDGVVASGGSQEERVPVGIPSERRQPHDVTGRGEQACIAADAVAWRDIRPALAGVGADPVVDPLPVAG